MPGSVLLAVIHRVDRRAVLRAYVITLPHTLRRVVAFPKNLEQFLEICECRVINDKYDFGMAGFTSANLFVRWIGRYATGITSCCRVDAVRIPEAAFRTPKATQAKYGLLHIVGKRPL